MGKLDLRSSHVVFGGLVLLTLMRVSRAGEQPMDFISVMERDTKLCQMPKLLHNSSLITDCRKIDYTTEVHNIGYDELVVPTSTCLVVYDTWYRLCTDPSHWHNRFNSTAAFNSYIDKFSLTGKDGDKDELCKNIQKIKPVYKKLKEQLLPFFHYLNDTKNCRSYCFLFDKLNPVCALLSQLRNSDEKTLKVELFSPKTLVPHVQTSTRNVLETIAQGVGPKQPESDKAEPKTELKHNSIEAVGVEEKQSSKKENKAVQSPQVSENLGVNAQNDKTKTPVAEQSSVSQKEQTTNIGAPPAAKNMKPEEKNSNPGHDLHNSLNNDASRLNNSASNSKVQVNPQSPVEDTKTSTLSENTQEQIDVVAGRDYSNLDKEPYDPDDADQPTDLGDQNQNMPEPSEQRDILLRHHSIRPEEESHFFTYFMVVSLVCVGGYAVYHNKQKILAMVVEGRRSRNNRGRRRPSTASYRKLDCTLEEAVTSQCNANVTHVIY